MTRLAILAALALSACASYDRPTYNEGTGCVESWTHSGTSIGLQAVKDYRRSLPVAEEHAIDPAEPVRGQFVTLTSDEQTLTEKGMV